MIDLNKIIAIFESTVTTDEIEKIKEKHTGLIHNFSNEEEFKAARKVRTEMNKVIEKVDRIGIDAAQDVTDMRNNLKSFIEDAYSGTVQPFLIENQKRKDDADRIKKEKADKLAAQKDTLNMMKGASQRAIHLPFDDIEQMVDDVMNVDLSAFEGDMLQEAQLAKDISLAQLGDALKFATEKEDMRKQKERDNAIIGDKDDEIARLMAMLAEKEPKKAIEKQEIETLEDELYNWNGIYNIPDSAFESLKDTIEQFVALTITR